MLTNYGDVILARQPASFNLTVNDQLELESWLRMGTLSQNLMQRAWILLLLSARQSLKEVMESLDVSSPIVFKPCNRYSEQGLTGLRDAPRSRQPRELDTKKVKSILSEIVN
jgi:transposase